MSTTEELINKYFTDRNDLEKMAQFELEKQEAFGWLEKVASEGQMDISQLSDQDRIELYNYLTQEMAQPEQEQVVNQPVEQTQEQPNQFMNYVAADPQREQEFYYKMAEAQITSDFWAENAADKFLNKVAFGMAKIAEAMEGKEEKEEKKDSSFEALAKEKAVKMKEEHEKKAAFDALVEQAARELIEQGKV